MEGLFGTILVSAIILAIVVLIIARMVINKRAGRRSCGMGCSGCSQNQSCIIRGDDLYVDKSDQDQ
jgi:hypothetical protein